ncbi:MAG: hypothetical protein WA160_04610 [Pseudobdellovibrio sp.]
MRSNLLSFLITAFVIALSPQLQALNFSGFVSRSVTGKLKLKDERLNKNFELTCKDPSVKNALKKLKTGDYLSFDGLKDPYKSKVLIDSINFVGLSQLLATWQGDDNYCYSFTSFNEFSIYPKSKITNCSDPKVIPRNFAYSISSSDTNWFVLISDNEASYTADLNIINPTKAEITLYDPNTGTVLRLVKLSK